MIKACGAVVVFKIPFNQLQEIAETPPAFIAHLRGVFESRTALVRSIDHARNAPESSAALEMKPRFFEKFKTCIPGLQLIRAGMQALSSRRGQ